MEMTAAVSAVLSQADIESAREKLIVALDFWTIDEATKLVKELGDEVTFYKIGLGLQLIGGDRFAKELVKEGKRVFLDYKWFDIEETIKNAVAQAAKIGISFLSLHGVNGILRGAVQGRGTSNLKILCVTVLTSMDAEDTQEMGFPPTMSVEELVIRRAVKALEIGVDGVIASALEASKIKNLSSGKLMVVAAAIRPLGSPADDQKRIATPSGAIKAGADYLVIGRPITGADNPRETAHKIIVEMADAMRELGEGASAH
jgi:orotidine-5'-phosphate decarboxylase